MRAIGWCASYRLRKYPAPDPGQGYSRPDESFLRAKRVATRVEAKPSQGYRSEDLAQIGVSLERSLSGEAGRVAFCGRISDYA